MILFSCSKTFLVGEYAVLFGGGAVVLSTFPHFHLHIKNALVRLVGVDSTAPAGLFFQNHIEVFENHSLRFSDPHLKAGGFGASSAQFVLLYKLYLELTNQQFDIVNFLDEYRELAANGGIPPSGADCICQFFNHHVFFDNNNYAVEKLDWNLPNLGFAIFKTNFKIPTHEHLKKIDPHLNISELQHHTLTVKEGMQSHNEQQVICGINRFFKELRHNQLVLPEIAELIDVLLKNEAIVAAKGCGALSADTVIIIYEKSQKTQAISSASQLGLSLVASS